MAPDDPQDIARPPIPVYAIFEGGGATGMTHIGAMKAMEQGKILPQGVAGASAGAIIAALLAVGYKADDVLNSSAENWNIFQRDGKSPVSILGKWNWALLNLARRWWVKWPVGILLLLVPILAVLFVALLLAAGLRLIGIGGPFNILMRLGFFSTEPARDFLNDRILEKLGSHALPEDGIVCFKHIDPANGFIPLKIVCTNIDEGCMELLDANSPDAVVADAVIASMSIPILFRPAAIRGHGKPGTRYVDGGLVSNLPIWAFLEDKLTAERRRGNSPPLPILAFTLKRVLRAKTKPGDIPAKPPGHMLAFLPKVLKTGVFGSQATLARTIPNLETIEMQSSLGLLAFDCGQEQAIQARDDGARQATAAFEQRFRLWPSQATSALSMILKELRFRLRALGQSPKALASLRVALLKPSAGQDLRVVASVNRDGDADDTMAYDAASPAAPYAFSSKDVHHFCVGGIMAEEKVMTKYEFARQRSSLVSLIAVPIFKTFEPWEMATLMARPTPLGLLVVDGDLDLEFAYTDDYIMKYLVQESVGLAGLLPPA